MTPVVDEAWVESVMATYDRSKSGVEAIEAAYAGAWAMQDEQARSLTTLSSGALVLSISIMQLLGPRLASSRWMPCLTVAWALFALTVILSIFRFGRSAEARQLGLSMFRNRHALVRSLHEISSDPVRAERGMVLLHEAVDRAFAGPRAADDAARRITITMLLGFATGLVCLLLFAMRNLPW